IVNFSSITGALQVIDNPLPPLVGLSKNGSLHLSFQAYADTLASYQASCTGPMGATVDVGQRADVDFQTDVTLAFHESLLPQPNTVVLNSGNFFNPGISVYEVDFTFPNPGLYEFQFTITGLKFDNTLQSSTMNVVVSVADSVAPAGPAVFWGPWSVTTHYPQGA